MSYPGYPNQSYGYPPNQQAPIYPPTNQQQIGFNQYSNQQPMGFNQYPNQQNQFPQPTMNPLPYPPNPGIPPLPTQNPGIPPLPYQNPGIPPLPESIPSYSTTPYSNPMNPPFGHNQSSAPPYPVSMNQPNVQAYPTQAYPTQAYPTQAYSAQTYSTQTNPSHAYPTQSHQAYPIQHQVTQSMLNATVPTIRMTPTVRPIQPFNPRQDAELLRKAMKGFGTDERSIINVLCNRSNQQRLEIKSQFKVLYGKDLIKELKSELSGNFEELVLATLMPLPEFLSRELHRAISGTGTDEAALIEILCTLDNAMIRTVAAQYQQLFRKSLESNIRGDTSGHFLRLLVSLTQGNRDQNPMVNIQAAVTDAQALLRAGAGRLGTDESTFNMIMASRSFPQLRQVFIEYQKISSGRTIEQAIRSEFSGDIMNAHLAIVKCVASTAGFFAEQLYQSIQGFGTKDQTLIRIVTWRSEIDMGEIKTIFQSKYHKTLDSFIQGDTSGDYRNMLLAMIN